MQSVIKTFFIVLVFSIGFAHALENLTDDSFEVSVDILATQEWAEVELNTTSIDFGVINLTTGSVTNERKNAYYEIRNKGNINITVTPILASGTDDIFDNLKFSKSVSDSLSSWKEIGNYSIEMNSTSPSPSWSDWQRYAIRLDLSNYLDSEEQIPFDIINHNNVVLFEVLPRYD